MAELVGALRAAGETTRLRLLALLAEGEHSVKDLTEILRQSQPRVSRHLKLLADAGLVTRNAEGAWAYYRLADDEAAELGQWLVRRLDANDPERSQDRIRLEAVRSARQAEAARYFAKVAERWDEFRRLHVSEENVEAAIVAAVKGRVVDLFIDLGTGTGRMLELLQHHYRRGIGIDSSREMLAVARSRLTTANIGHAQVRLGDITELEGSVGAAADLIAFHQVLHYFDDPGRAIAQARRALRPGGEMLVVDFAPHELEFLRTEHAHRRLGISESQMAGWARSAGLAVAELTTFPPTTSAEALTVCLWRLRDEQDSR